MQDYDSTSFVFEYGLLSGRTAFKSISYHEVTRISPICLEVVEECRRIARLRI